MNRIQMKTRKLLKKRRFTSQGLIMFILDKNLELKTLLELLKMKGLLKQVMKFKQKYLNKLKK